MSIDPTAAAALTYYVADRKLTPDVATGICCVLYGGESRLNPGSQGTQGTETGGVLNPNGAYGIASWNGVRQADLLKFATLYSLNAGDLDTQLHFVLTESAGFSQGSNPGGYPKTWAAITTSSMTWQNFIPIFISDYENPADPTKEANNSTPYGPSFLAYAQTVQPPGPLPSPTPIPTPTPTPTPSPTPTISPQDIIAILTAIAPLLSNQSTLAALANLLVLLLSKA